VPAVAEGEEEGGEHEEAEEEDADETQVATQTFITASYDY
jgi:hypothetical protein